MKKVVIIDDSISILNAISRVVTKTGHEPITFEKIDDAFEKIDSGELNPDLILVDIIYPGKGSYYGLSLTKKIRDTGYTGKIVAFTSLEPIPKSHFEKHGLDDWLNKGVPRLKEKILEYISDSKS